MLYTHFCEWFRNFGIHLAIQEVVPAYLDMLTDDELKKEAKNEAKNDALSSIIKSLKCLVSRIPGQEEKLKSLEMFRLKMILRWVLETSEKTYCK